MAKGRMTNKGIALSASFQALPQQAKFLFLAAIPHQDREGRITGHPVAAKGMICPLNETVSAANMSDAMLDWAAAGMALVYVDESGKDVVQFTGFAASQGSNFRADREARSVFGDPPAGLTPAKVRQRSGKGPELRAEDCNAAESNSNVPLRINSGKGPAAAGLSPPNRREENIKEGEGEGETREGPPAPSRNARVEQPAHGQHQQQHPDYQHRQPEQARPRVVLGDAGEQILAALEASPQFSRIPNKRKQAAALEAQCSTRMIATEMALRAVAQTDAQVLAWEAGKGVLMGGGGMCRMLLEQLQTQRANENAANNNERRGLGNHAQTPMDRLEEKQNRKRHAVKAKAEREIYEREQADVVSPAALQKLLAKALPNIIGRRKAGE